MSSSEKKDQSKEGVSKESKAPSKKEGIIPKKKKLKMNVSLKQKRALIVLAVIVVLLLLLGALFQTGKLGFMKGIFSSGSPIASVNGEEITTGEFRERFDPVKETLEERLAEMGKNAGVSKSDILSKAKNVLLNQMILEEILISKARSTGVEVTPKEVNDLLEDFQARYEQTQGTLPKEEQKTFEESLALAGMTMTEYRENLANLLLIKTFIVKTLALEETSVTAQEIEARYKKIVAGPAFSQGEKPTLEDLKPTIENMLLQEIKTKRITDFTQRLRKEAQVKVLWEGYTPPPFVKESQEQQTENQTEQANVSTTTRENIERIIKETNEKEAVSQ